jgi:uncharacterized protein DUF3185
LRRIIGLALVGVGVVLLVWGFSAADSFASDVSRFFTGSPTDRAIWLTIAGVAAIVAGGVAAALPTKALA